MLGPLNFVAALLTIFLPISIKCQAQEELILVHALFRHGHRTIDSVGIYPKDPYVNETYYPYGIGQLTNAGKLREFELGEYMRKKYGAFLGHTYTPEIVDAVSTEVNRTKASLELVLAGLFPPRGTEMNWNPKLNWQPIPYNVLYYKENNYLTIPLYYCADYAKLYWANLRSAQGVKLQFQYKDLFEYLSKHTGLDITTTMDVWTLYSGLLCEEEWGLELPPWTYLVYPDLLYNASVQELQTNTATNRLKQLSGGFLLRKIISDTEAKINNKLTPAGRKIFLYSAHDLNVALFLRTLEVYFPHLPPYGACVFIEIYKKNKDHGVKIFYQDYTQVEPKALKVPGCDFFCPLKTFTRLLQQNIAASNDTCGEDDEAAFKKFIHMRRFYSIH